MRAVTVAPGERGSHRLTEVPAPERGPGEALVRVASVGICGTDREIVENGGGVAPPGERRLILGHESLGRVERGAGGLEPGDLVAAIVRRPDPVPCLNCGRGEWDMCLNGRYTERGIKGRHGFLSDVYAELPEYLVPVPEALEPVGALLEPASIVAKGVSQIDRIQDRLVWEPGHALVTGAGPIGLLAAAFLRMRGLDVTVYDLAEEGPKVDLARGLGCTYLAAARHSVQGLDADVAVEATGHPPVVVDVIASLASNGIACLMGVTDAGSKLEVPAGRLAREVVLGNKVVFGTVNANRAHFDSARDVLEQIQRRWPGWLDALVTRRVPLERYAEALRREPDDVKVLIDLDRQR